MKTTALIVVLASIMAARASAQFVESEPNDDKAHATVIAGLAAGGTIVGMSTGSSTGTGAPASADTFDITTAALPPGIHEHRLTLTSAGALAHTLTLRGLTQASGVIGPGDVIIQTAGAVGTSRVLKWYGFGRSERLYVRVTGSTSTSAPYTLTLSTTPVTPVDAGCFEAGMLTISTVGQTTTDTDLWVYDAGLAAIPGYGNDDEPAPGTALQSQLTRSFVPGRYYVAVSRFNCANDLPPAPDDRFQNGSVLDFPDILAQGSAATNSNCNMQITDVSGATAVTGLTAFAPNGVAWISFGVVATSTPSRWERNGPGADLAINGIQNGTANQPASLTIPVSQPGTLALISSNAGQGWELGIGYFPGVPGPDACGFTGIGGIPTANGQVVNLDVTDPLLFFANQLSFPALPAGGASIPFTISVAIANVSVQAVVLSPTHADGYELSQLTQLRFGP